MKVKKQMRENLLVGGLMLVLLSGCMGCGKQQNVLNQSPVIPLKEHSEKNVEEADNTVSSLPYSENEIGVLDEENSVRISANVLDGEPMAEIVSTQLTQEELDSFTECFNKERANGFLMCSYDIPSRIDLTSVLKSIGYTGEEISEKEQVEANVLFGKTTRLDVVKYTSDYLVTLLHEMTGLGLSEINTKPTCPYSSSYDAYYMKKSDIVLREITCTAGSVDSEGIYSIFYTKAGEEGLWNVVLRKRDGEINFHSNTSLTPEN